MFIVTLTIAASLSQPPANGVQLKPAYAITEPNDIQPALGLRFYQATTSPQSKPILNGQLQPAEVKYIVQRTVNPQAQGDN